MVGTFVYVCICVCVCSQVNIDTPVCVEAKENLRCHAQECHLPTLRMGLALNLPVRLDCLTNEPQEFCRLPLPNTGIASMYHHVQHLIQILGIKLRSPCLRDKHLAVSPALVAVLIV